MYGGNHRAKQDNHQGREGGRAGGQMVGGQGVEKERAHYGTGSVYNRTPLSTRPRHAFSTSRDGIFSWE